MEYLWLSSCLYWHSQNQHTANFNRSTEHPISWEVWLCHTSSVFDACCLLTEAHGEENHSPMVPSETHRTDHLPLSPAVLPCFMFWTFMELEIWQEWSWILQFLCWPASPPAVLHCLTMSCPSQIGSCCSPGPGRWGKCFLVPSPYRGEPNASGLLQWHTDNLTGKLGTLTPAWTLIQWFSVKF